MCGSVPRVIDLETKRASDRAIIVGIDPGPLESAAVAVVFYKDGKVEVLEHAIAPNTSVLKSIERVINTIVLERVWVAVEVPHSMGMPIGNEVLETAYWAGFFAGKLASLTESRYGVSGVKQYKRWMVKRNLCGTVRANDSAIRAKMIELYGPVGTSKEPGPLYGLKNDEWQALAVASCMAQDILKASE